MKFKKVEISAFRIYDKPEDATFDFSLPDGIADFVAIYAPNGFGKTSFYDAIEWGVTNNINRFWQDAAITEKSIEALKNINESQIKLWRNTYSEQDTFVKILTDTQTVFNRTLNVHGNSKIDITNEEVVENKGFRQVILSQEWISAFLKEINGERRYEIFMENPDLREINSYYSNLKSIFSLTQERINATRQLITDKQKELITNSEGNVLQSVNTQITNLNSKYHAALPQLSITSTQENVVEFKNTISAQIVGANSSVASVQAKLDSIGIARSGSLNIPSEQNYQEATKRIPQVEKEIETIIANIKKHDDLKSLIERRTSLNTSFQKKITESEILTQIIEDFQTYLEVNSAINKNQSEIKTKEKELSDLEGTSDNYQEQLNLTKTKQDSTLRNISDTEAKISQVPELASQLNEVTVQIADKKRTQSELYLIIETDKIDTARIINELNRYNQLKENLSNSSFDIQSDSYPKELEKQYQNLRTTKLSVSALRKSIEELQIKIDQQQEFNNTIQNFINEGYEIIRKNQTSTCPLCEFEYKSFSELASKVTNNKALASLLQDLLQQKQTLQESINTQNSLIDSEINFITKYYESLIQDLNLTLSTLQGKIASTELQQSKNNEELGFIDAKSHEIVSQFKGLSSVEYETQLSESLNQLIKEREINAETVMRI